jgi:dTDP-4-amino-4,6-dideoxygalactose transaminase
MENLKTLRNHGMQVRYYHSKIGGNFRLDTLQAVILDIKLKYLEDWNEARAANAKRYNELLADLEAEGKITLPKALENRRHTYNQYCPLIKHNKRDALVAGLKEAGIGSDIYYPVSVHMQECLEYLNYKEGDFQVSEALAKEIIALPISPELTKEQLSYVAETIKSLL